MPIVDLRLKTIPPGQKSAIAWGKFGQQLGKILPEYLGIMAQWRQNFCIDEFNQCRINLKSGTRHEITHEPSHE